jgi:hypothetical protein
MPANSSGCARHCVGSRATPAAFAAALEPLARNHSVRDIERQLGKVPEGVLRARLVEMIARVFRLLAQKPKDKKRSRPSSWCNFPDGLRL